MELLFDSGFDGSSALCEEESRHCIGVMRHRAGDTVHVTDGRGNHYVCEVAKADTKHCLLNVVEHRVEPAPAHRLHMAVAPTKNTDRFEWFVEKAIELGVSEITPIVCARSERVRLRTDRLQRVAVAAAKQSLKFHLPIINEPTPAEKVIAEAAEACKFILHCGKTIDSHLFNAVRTGTSTLVLIGPEGDFSPAEIALALANGFAEATLGPERLRTETAAMAACHIVDLKNTIGNF